MSEFEAQNIERYVRKLDEEPAFLTERLETLESMARTGKLTNGRELEFTAGIEIEFALPSISKVHEAIAEKEGNKDSQQLLAESVLDIEVLNNNDPAEISDEKLIDMRDEIRVYVDGLIPTNDTEAQKKAKWLSEVDDFTATDIMNYMLYSEFSNPSLGDINVPKGASLQDITEYTNQQGWIEFRFGKGELQSGYYDNEGTCELRMAPCSPSEAARREKIISARMVEIAKEFGAVPYIAGKHLNLGVYSKNEEGTFMPIIGNTAERLDDTRTIMAGVGAAFQDRLWLSQEKARYGHTFGPSYIKDGLRFGPTRKGIRILDDYLELRNKSLYQNEAQGFGWLMSGVVGGIAAGAEELKAEGYQIPEVVEVFKVSRNQEFTKESDLHIQRAFENAKLVDGKFELDVGYNFMRGSKTFDALVGGEIVLDEARDIFNDVVMGGVKAGADGVPFCTGETLKSSLASMKKSFQDKLAESFEDAAKLAAIVNKQLSKVRLEGTQVVAGEIEQPHADSLEEAKLKLLVSPFAHIQYGDKLEEYVAWMAARSNTLYKISN